jgi:hypothetical protein
MGSRSRRSGNRWEREFADIVDGKRQPSSGAFGTQIGDATLTGDVLLSYPWWHQAIIAECKYGYGSSKSMRIQRKWFTKVRKEAENSRRLPCVALKFRDVTGGDIESAKVICFNLDIWQEMMQEVALIYSEYLSMLDEKFEMDAKVKCLGELIKEGCSVNDREVRKLLYELRQE